MSFGNGGVFIDKNHVKISPEARSEKRGRRMHHIWVRLSRIHGKDADLVAWEDITGVSRENDDKIDFLAGDIGIALKTGMNGEEFEGIRGLEAQAAQKIFHAKN